jgi:ribose transport system ATP-binding protein
MAGHRPDVGTHVEGSGPRLGAQRESVLTFDGVSTDVLRDVTLSIAAGEVVGVTGVIGAGGHEIARLLFGLTRPTQGQVTLAGKPLVSRGPRDSLSQGVCLVPEDPARDGMVAPMTVASNITLVDLKSFSRFGWLSHRRERRAAQGYVKDLGIATRSVDTLVGTLSGGNQQKVLLARALTANAQVLVLEEPTQGVDVHAKAEIHKLIRRLAADGKAVVVISTDVQDLLEFVDRVIALRRGRVARDVGARETSFAEILDVTVGTVGEAA